MYLAQTIPCLSKFYLQEVRQEAGVVRRGRQLLWAVPSPRETPRNEVWIRLEGDWQDILDLWNVVLLHSIDLFITYTYRKCSPLQRTLVEGGHVKGNEVVWSVGWGQGGWQGGNGAQHPETNALQEAPRRSLSSVMAVKQKAWMHEKCRRAN